MSARQSEGPRLPDRETMLRVVTHPVYRRACSHIRSFLVRSRVVREDPGALLDLQVDMASCLLAFQERQRRLESRADDHGEREETRDEARLRVAAARRLQHLVRQVADGIAWRLFAHDRLALYQLARKPQTGYLEAATIQSEIDEASVHVDDGTLVLLNDLTHFVRYADYTLFRDDAIEFIEVKARKRSRESGHATRQSQKLKAMANFINTQRRQSPGGNEALLRVKTEPKTHQSSVQGLISDARRQGNANARLSDCLAVDVYHMKSVEAVGLGVQHNPFSGSMKSIRGDSLQPFYHFTQNKAPYSVFPWPDADCADVLVGEVWVVSYFNWGKVERMLRKRDLVVSDLDAERLRRLVALPFPEQKRQELGLTIGRKNSPHFVTISFIEFARLAYEFLHEDAFADAIEEVLEVGIPPGDRYFTAFENEAAIWN